MGKRLDHFTNRILGYLQRIADKYLASVPKDRQKYLTVLHKYGRLSVLAHLKVSSWLHTLPCGQVQLLPGDKNHLRYKTFGPIRRFLHRFVIFTVVLLLQFIFLSYGTVAHIQESGFHVGSIICCMFVALNGAAVSYSLANAVNPHQTAPLLNQCFGSFTGDRKSGIMRWRKGLPVSIRICPFWRFSLQDWTSF